MGNGDQIFRSYSILSSLKENLPDTFEVPESWVTEFHGAITQLENATGIELSEFKIPSEHIKQSVGSSNYLTKEVRYLDGLWCHRSILIHKISAILVYFTGLMSGQEKKIGFGR